MCCHGCPTSQNQVTINHESHFYLLFLATPIQKTAVVWRFISAGTTLEGTGFIQKTAYVLHCWEVGCFNTGQQGKQHQNVLLKLQSFHTSNLLRLPFCYTAPFTRHVCSPAAQTAARLTGGQPPSYLGKFSRDCIMACILQILGCRQDENVTENIFSRASPAPM